MQIPVVVKILGLEWQVRRDSHVTTEGNVYGSTHHSTQTIFLDPTNTPQHDEQVFIHEMMHAIWWQMGLTKMPDTSPAKEEQIISALANGLYHALKENNLLA